MEDLFELGDLLDGEMPSDGVQLDETLSEATAQGRKSMDNARNLMIGIVGIAILAFLISVVLKKMNKSKK